MDVYFEAPALNLLKEGIGYFISLFWNYLERRTETKLAVHIHQPRAEGDSRGGFHVMGQYASRLRAFRPKPNEGDSNITVCPEGQFHQLLEQSIHASVDRPLWERVLQLAAQVNALKDAANAHWHQGSSQVVQIPYERPC